MATKAVVIGTGAGGLTAAAYLARRYGLEVVALERAQQFGGFMNPFKRKKYEFDPGIHYVGQCRRGEAMYNALAGLDLDAEEMFAELDPDGFDLYQFGDFEIRMCAGADRYRDRLVDAFPHEEAGIDRFFHAVHQVDDLSRLMAGRPSIERVLASAKSLPVARWIRSTFADLLKWAVDDPHLRDVLAAPCGDYGEPPSRASALYGLALFSHYMNGAFFPRGGSRAFRDAILNRAKDAGAEFHRNTTVEEIVVRDGKAVAVRTNKGEFEADVVVSAVSPTLTFETLLRGAGLPRRLHRKVKRLKPSPASICLFLGMERDLSEHGMGRYDIWSYPHWDIDSCYEDLYEGRFPEDPTLFLSPNSLKDPTGSLAPEGCSTLEVVTFAPYRWFSEWDGMRAMFRPDEYVGLKEDIAKRILDSLDRRYPGLVGDIVIQEIATPVSITHYVNSVEGGIYGPAATPDQSMIFRFRPTTPVSNVFLAGSGVFGGGILPCLQSGRIAAKLAAHHARHHTE